MRRPRRRRAPPRRRAVLAAAVALAVAVGAWQLLSGDTEEVRLRSGLPAPAAVPAPSGARAEIASSLRRGVRRAAALGGEVEAAAMFAAWRRPIVVASPRDGRLRWMRMWSMSKVVTAVALLRALGWGDRPGKPLSPEAERALWGALTRSENCRQRRVILELQLASGGSPARARRAVAAVLHTAGAKAHVGRQVAPPDAGCIEYLEGEEEIAEPLAPALLLGTSTWRVGDAVRFARALAAGAYGEAVANVVLAAMRAPKAPSREVAPGELTAPLGWGAGHAFAGRLPAYKPGWGGSRTGDFMAGQIALVESSGRRPVAVAVVFHPDVQPATDDPGTTAAPDALERVMVPLSKALG